MSSFITREHDYAIRITAFLAGYYPGGQKSVADISRLIAVPRSITAKIVHLLKHAGILDTNQGRFGGVYLVKDPEKLSFYDVLSAMGFNSALNECVINPRICNLVYTCKIHQFFLHRQQEFIQALKSAMIANFSFDESALSIISGKYCGT